MSRWLPTVLVGCLLLPATGKLYAYDEYNDTYSYVSGGWHHWSSADSSADGVKMNLGQQLTPFISAEASFAIGGKDSDTDASLERLFGLYGKFTLPLGFISPYAKLGATFASIEVAKDSTNEFELSYGMGTELNITSRFYVDLEYMVYLDTEKLELDGFTLGIGYKIP